MYKADLLKGNSPPRRLPAQTTYTLKGQLSESRIWTDFQHGILGRRKGVWHTVGTQQIAIEFVTPEPR